MFFINKHNKKIIFDGISRSSDMNSHIYSPVLLFVLSLILGGGAILSKGFFEVFLYFLLEFT